MRIAFLGPEGSFSHEAVMNKYRRGELISCLTIEDAFEKVFTGQVDYSVLPVENSTEGIISLTYHLIVELGFDSKVKVCGEFYHKINLNLVAVEKVGVENIRTVHTKDTAWGQCRGWVSRNLSKSVEFIPESSTSRAAQKVFELKDKDKAAVCGRLAAEIYNLTILSNNIQDFRDNCTRFFIIGRRSLPRGSRNAKSTLGMILLDKVGAISIAFGIFAKNGLDVRSVKVTPVRAPEVVSWKDWFFADVVSKNGYETIAACMQELEIKTDVVLTIRNLGFYADNEPRGLNLDRYLHKECILMSNKVRIQAEAISLDELNSIGKREGQQIELKSSLRWNLKEGKKDKILEHAIVKTIVGFMNSSGGKLVIGVNDEGEVLGLDNDYNTLQKPSQDGFELHLRNIVRSAIGGHLMNLIMVNFLSRESKDICLVIIKPASTPVWIKEDSNEEFYVRSGNQTIPLNKRETVEYIKHRWG